MPQTKEGKRARKRFSLNFSPWDWSSWLRKHFHMNVGQQGRERETGRRRERKKMAAEDRSANTVEEEASETGCAARESGRSRSSRTGTASVPSSSAPPSQINPGQEEEDPVSTPTCQPSPEQGQGEGGAGPGHLTWSPDLSAHAHLASTLAASC